MEHRNERSHKEGRCEDDFSDSEERSKAKCCGEDNDSTNAGIVVSDIKQRDRGEA
jgi:hypothetical protein